MSFIELFIKRPALTIVLSLVITIVGIMSYISLQVRWIPNVTPSIISIYTAYPGASSSLIEAQITTPLENALAGVDGIDTVYSSSKQGVSDITLTFKHNHNINVAMEDVRGALQGGADSLPREIRPPTISKTESDGQPILYIAFSDLHRSDKEINNYVKQFVRPQLQSIDGVAAIQTYGERIYALRIWLDPMKMAAANVTADDVIQVLNQQNIQVPSGQIHGLNRLYTVVTNETLKSSNEFNALIIRQNQEQVIRLKDIGQAVVDAENSDSAFRADGQSAVALAVIPQSVANPLSVADAIEQQFKSIQKALPEGMQAKIIFNEATFIHASINGVYESLAEAVLCVLFVVFIFLGTWRAAFIPIITIPICLLSSFSVLYLCGFSINTITLMAFVLAIGLVVDDAIVMLENITRYVEQGLPPWAAAVKGGREIVLPIIAMTLTLVAVYAPIAFTSGLLSAVFREFAITLAGTVIISGLVALILTPMMCSRLLTRQANSRYLVWLNEKMHHLQSMYVIFLNKALQKKQQVGLVLLAVIMLGGIVYYFIPSELAPNEDTGMVEVSIAGPKNASFQYTDSYARQLEEIYKKIPDVESFGSSVGFGSPSHGFQFLTLKPLNQRSHSAEQIVAQLDEQVKLLPGVRVNVFPPSSPLTWYAEANGSNISMEVMAATDYRKLYDIMQQLLLVVQKYPEFSSIDSKLKWDQVQFELNINREKAADMHIPMQNITNTISIFLAGRYTGYYEYDGNQYNIIVQGDKALLENPNIVSQLYVRNDFNNMVPISGLINLKETTAPEVLPHFNRLRDDVLFATIAPGYTMGQAINTLQKIARDNLPEDVKFSFQGAARDYLESAGSTQFTFLLALIFIYLILVAQFESFIDPLIILLTVPFAIIGALFTLKLTGCTLNIYSNIGLVTLIGLIAKHGILITEFANQQRALGLTSSSAVLEAAKLRLRPILMTTAAMVLGALPLALATGSGAESRCQVGWVIVGGLLFGTFFSLIVVPVAYIFFARFKKVTVLNSPLFAHEGRALDDIT